jgi:hypothetical protein
MDATTTAVDLERAKMAIDRLERENAALRRQVLDAGHRASVLAGRCKSCEFHPDQSKVETQAIVRKNREHA